MIHMEKETRISAGRIVRATAGRDEGGYFAVLGLFREKGIIYALIADGKERKIGKPKKKNIKHLVFTKTVIEVGDVSDKYLRKVLREFGAAKESE